MSATPIYQHIEFVDSPERLWGKIESKWDWLAVKPDKTFVVGYPKRQGPPRGGNFTAVADDAEIGQHGVRVRQPNSGGANYHWFPTQDRAIDHYRAVVAQEIEVEGPGLIRVERIEANAVVEHEFVVRRHSTYR